MNSKVISSSVLLLLINFALDAQPLLKECPKVSAVQNVASNFKVKKYDPNYNIWYAYQINKFNTNYLWSFMIVDVHAKNADEAHNKFMTSLSHLHFVNGADGEDGSVECHYKTADGLKAVAETPPVFQD